MATATLKLSSYSTVTVEYSVVDTATAYGMTVSSVTFANSRSGGLPNKSGFVCTGMVRRASGDDIVAGAWNNLADATLAAGTKSKAFTVGKTVTYAKTHSSEPVRLYLKAELHTPNDDYYAESRPASATVQKAHYDVTYAANGGSGTTSAQTKWHGESLSLRSNGFTRAGFSFLRWNTDASNAGTGYAAGAAYAGNAKLALHAIWNRAVSYSANGGAGAPASQAAVATAAITLSTARPAREGWRFRCWNTAADGTGTDYKPGGSYPANKPSATLHAQWERVVAAVRSEGAAAVRVASTSSTAEADEGRFAYATVPFRVEGAAAASVEMTCSGLFRADGTSAGISVTRVSYSASKQAGSALEGAFTARVNSALDADATYYFDATVTASNSSGVAQDPVRQTVRVTIATAFFTMDARAGGHGVSFGSASAEDGFNVSMDMYAQHRRMYPCHVIEDSVTAEDDALAAIDAMTEKPPFFVYVPSNGGFYWNPG